MANWLATHHNVATVNHPALESCKGHSFFKRDFTGASSLFSFVLKEQLTSEQLKTFLNGFNHFAMAY